jgi:hypothetical protein
MPLALRAAAIERDWLLVDIAVFMSLAAWVPGGFRPLWLPLAFGAGGALFVVVSGAVGRAVSALAERALPRRHGATLAADDDGLTIRTHPRAPETRCRWQDVERAFVFKRDLYTTDLVCLALVTSDGILEVNERDEGWPALVAVLEERLPGCESFATWFLEVIHEPFAPRARQIYGPALPPDSPLHAAPVDEFPATVAEDAETETASGAWASLRDYLTCGTAGLILAATFVLAVVGAFHGPRSLVYAFAPVAVGYVLLSRLALAAWLGLQSARGRTSDATIERGL